MSSPQRRFWLIGALVGAAVIACVVALLARSGGSNGGGTSATAAPTDGGVAAPVKRDPVRCARMAGAKTTHVDAAPLVIGVVADSRGARPPTLKRLRTIRAAFDRDKVNLIISLGGMGRNEADIYAALRALATPAGPTVVAIPGDREAVAAHRAAIARLAGTGAKVVDGSSVRFVDTGAAVVGTLPGVARAAQLVAGADGCVHTDADVDAFAKRLAGFDTLRIWAGYAPPRQRGLDASDLSAAGVHIGERHLAGAVGQAKAALVVHGLVDAAAVRAQGKRSRSDNSVSILAAGSADTLPATIRGGQRRSGTALVVRVEREQIRWQRL